MKRIGRRLRSVGPQVTIAVLFLAVWQLAVSLFHIPAWQLPGPAAVIREAVASFDRIGEHVAATFRLTVFGFAVGSLIGLIIACLLHMSEKLKSAFYPFLVLSQNVPTIVLAPLLMIWFGFGLFPKIVVITLVCFFPVAVAALDGFARTDRTMYAYMQMAGATKGQIFRKLEFPHALPHLFSGLKISATYSVMGAIIGEWLGTDKGIGMYMLLQKSSFRIDRVFVAIAFIVLMSLAMFALIVLLERWLIRWKTKP